MANSRPAQDNLSTVRSGWDTSWYLAATAAASSFGYSFCNKGIKQLKEEKGSRFEGGEQKRDECGDEGGLSDGVMGYENGGSVWW